MSRSIDHPPVIQPHQSRRHRLDRIIRALSKLDEQAERCHQWQVDLNRRRADLQDERSRLIRGGAR